MAKFRWKHPIVEALQWTGKDDANILRFGNGKVVIYYNDTPGSKRVVTRSFVGEVGVFVGDWIVRDENGECHPCEPDIFKRAYEEMIE